MADARELVAWSFLIPVVRDSDRKPHAAIEWKFFQDELFRLSGGLQGPEEVLYYRKKDTVPGAWLPADSDSPVEDLCRRYTVVLEAGREDELRTFLRRVGNSFDQRVIYLEKSAVSVEFLAIEAADGFLEG